MNFAAIYVPDFPVEAVVRAEPELREQAVAVVEGTPPLLHVAADNERARAAGVEIGMTRLEAEGRLAAQAAAAACSAATPGGGWQVRRRSPAQEAAAHAALIDCACAFSPRVEDDAATPDTVVLDLSGLERLFGPPAKIARELARRASELGLEANVAVAANAEAAVHAARGFAGVTVIAPGEEAERLGILPVEVLLAGTDALAGGGTPEAGQAMEILETLARWGIRTFRALAMLPETAVRQRLGEAGLRLQKLARGEGSRPLVPVEPPLRFEETVELEYPVALLEPLSFLLNRMLEQLCARLAIRALATREIRLQLSLERDADISDLGFEIPHSPEATADSPVREVPNPQPEIPNGSARGAQEYTLRLPVPMLDAKVFLKLLQLELRRQPPGAPVEKIFLAVEPAPPRFTQGGLFLPAAPEPEKLELMLARIGSMVSGSELPVSGETAHASGNRKLETSACPADELRVGSAELLDTHRPDAFRMKQFAPPGPAAASRSPAAGHWPEETQDFSTHQEADTAAQSPDRPVPRSSDEVRTALRRFRPPLPVRVEVRQGRPANVIIAGFRISDLGFARSAGNSEIECQSSYSANKSEIPNPKSEIANVLWAAGPWRESGEWWTGEPWSREVWDVALRNEGDVAFYRVFRNVASGEWFVEAAYD